MRNRFLVFSAITVLTAAISLAGCGDDDDKTINLESCGNGVIDAGEECDDGNASDTDACTTLCRTAECGDGFVQSGVEECDTNPSPGQTCTSLGLPDGTLGCSASCELDTSGCTGSGATVTPTPDTGPTPTPTETPAGTPTPVATVTPGPGACAGGEDVVVVVAIDEGYGSARVDLAYPAAVNIPGSGSGSDVAGRVAFAPSGIKVVNDFDDDGDLADDTLTASLVSTEDNPAGTFVTVTFDCVAGQSAPAAGQFTCTVVSAATGGGSLIDPPPGCSVTVQ